MSAGMETDASTRPRPGLPWWLRQILFTGVAVFFAWFGTCLLIGAYRLGDPFSFIMTFFGACLMIMISAVMAMGFIVRMRQAVRSDLSVEPPPPPD